MEDNISNYLTKEQIWLEDGGVFTAGDFELRKRVSEIFTTLPSEVAESVLQNCSLFMPRTIQKGMLIPENISKEKRIILIPEGLLNDEKELKHSLLHEVAHYWLSHKDPIELDNSEYEKQEREAEEMVEKWKKMQIENEN